MNDNQLTFIEIQNFDYSLEILEWRNDELTRKNSINESIINQKDHELWLKSKIDSKDTLLLIYFYNSEPCALIKLDKLDKGKFGISINLNPEFRGKKISSSIINSSLHYLIKIHDLKEINVLASIKPFNIPSIKSFERSGFIKIENKDSNELLLFSKKLNKVEKILFLGYSPDETKLVHFLKDCGFEVVCKNSKLENDGLAGFDYIISYGYRHIITESQLLSAKQIPINLHISYLPYNRGAHPNFWAYYDETPHGVTIHRIDKGIDTGSILLQKKINLKKDLSFRASYHQLRFEIEKLFIENIDNLIYSTLKPFKNTFEGTFHLVKDLPKNVDWDLNIQQFKRLKN
tara:strand:+ start:2859 stop:3896 length:1038 start_codon:yes stop_codon:yes gene_type:complete